MQDINHIDQQATARKIAAARASIAASALLALTKFVAGWWSGSLALLSEGGHAAVDTGAAVLTYFAVKEAGKPADAEHHYGHGKYESLAALAETGLLFGLSLFVVIEAFRRISEADSEIDAAWPVFAVLGFSIVVDFFRSRQLKRIAREEGSDALAADALHFSSDLISSVLVVIGLLATRQGFARGDALAAVGVAVFIAVAGFRLGRRTVETLLDAAPRELVPRLERAIGDVPGVIAVESLRLRTVGHQAIGEAAIGVSRTLPLEHAARIKQAAEAAVLAEAPNAQITFTVNPRVLDDETVAERIRVVAARKHLPVHHIIAQQLGERLAISLDIEVDGTMQHGRAHSIATGFEQAIRDEFGSNVEIETHIEPLEPHLRKGRDAEKKVIRDVERALTRHCAAVGRAADVHEVRVRETDDGIIVNYHCRVDSTLSVDAVHAAVDAIERAVREEFPQIVRIVGHAEPADCQ
jgi:cation diffusion facilitator family transporter